MIPDILDSIDAWFSAFIAFIVWLRAKGDLIYSLSSVSLDGVVGHLARLDYSFVKGGREGAIHDRRLPGRVIHQRIPDVASAQRRSVHLHRVPRPRRRIHAVIPLAHRS